MLKSTSGSDRDREPGNYRRPLWFSPSLDLAESHAKQNCHRLQNLRPQHQYEYGLRFDLSLKHFIPCMNGVENTAGCMERRLHNKTCERYGMTAWGTSCRAFG